MKMATEIWMLFMLYIYAFCLDENQVFVFESDPSLDNKVCDVDDDRVLQENAKTPIRCAALCADHPLCNSLFYKEENETCFGCDTIYEDSTMLADEADTKYYRARADRSVDQQEGWDYFDGMYYKVITDEALPAESQDKCQALKANLVKITSPEENSFIGKLMLAKGVTDALIGLSANITGGYRWVVDGSKPTYNNWRNDDEPQIESCGCVFVSEHFNYTWYCRLCDYGSPYVCERK